MAEQVKHASPGALVEELVVQPGTYGTGTVTKGRILRIVDLEGEQVGDFCSWNLDEPSEYCDVIYSMFAKSSWKLGEGDVFYTKDMHPLWTIVKDTPGVHYFGGGFCSRSLNEWEDVHQHGCRDTLEEALATHGLSPLYLSPSACFNVFMHFAYDPDGKWEIQRPVTRPGDYIDLRAEMDVLRAVSCCQFPGECRGDKPPPLEFEVYEPPSSYAGQAAKHDTPAGRRRRCSRCGGHNVRAARRRRRRARQEAVRDRGHPSELHEPDAQGDQRRDQDSGGVVGDEGRPDARRVRSECADRRHQRGHPAQSRPDYHLAARSRRDPAIARQGSGGGHSDHRPGLAEI